MNALSEGRCWPSSARISYRVDIAAKESRATRIVIECRYQDVLKSRYIIRNRFQRFTADCPKDLLQRLELRFS